MPGDPELFPQLRQYLIDHILGPEEAEIYILALQNRYVTSVSVKTIPGIDGSKVNSKLNKMERDGYLTHIPGNAKGGAGKRGDPKKYYAVPPATSLRGHLGAAKKLWEMVEQFNEEMEVGPALADEEEVWQLPNEAAAMDQLARDVATSSSEILMYCSDATWWSHPGLRQALQAATGKGVKLTVVGTRLAEGTANELRAAGARVVATTVPMTPFAIVDRHVYLPCKTGYRNDVYGSVRLSNSYTRQGFVALIQRLVELGGEQNGTTANPPADPSPTRGNGSQGNPRQDALPKTRVPRAKRDGPKGRP